MRFVIGCALSLIFSANCAHAMAPVKDAPNSGVKKVRSQAAAEERSLANIDYSKIVGKAIQTELKEREAVVSADTSKVAEIQIASSNRSDERRRAIILPSHRSLKAAAAAAAPQATRGVIRNVEVPPSVVAEDRLEEEALPGIY